MAVKVEWGPPGVHHVSLTVLLVTHHTSHWWILLSASIISVNNTVYNGYYPIIIAVSLIDWSLKG